MNQTIHLQVSNLNKTYRHGKQTVLKDINFTAKAGECIGILGTNGCGKSTLLTLLAGIQTPNSGTIHAFYEDATTSQQPVIGYVPQENPLIEELTVYDNLKLWYSNSPLQLDKELEEGSLAMLSIPSFLKKKVKHLSGGMKKRLTIGCALACNPQILLLDEPGAALDLPCKEEILSYLKSYKSAGNIVIIATHEEPEIALCDHIFLLRDGTLTEFEYNGDLNALLKGIS